MILRDPVHGLVSFEGARERVVTRLLATREVQRLRRVRQLGLTSLVFPGAEHSRFAHAVGTAHVMARLQDRLESAHADRPDAPALDEEARLESLAAALLHDLGHGPFSHLFEEVLVGGASHETWTIRALDDPSTEVHQALESLAHGMAHRVAELLGGRYRLPVLARAVSGTLDVDRCDYLLRDSHMTGVRYGLYDLDWLLRALTVAPLEPTGVGVLAVEGRKGLPPVEAFFLGRHFMYRQVYHHKATRAAETLIRGLFLRMAELAKSGVIPEGTPPALVRAARGEPLELHEYLALDDAALLTAFAAWERSRDPILSDLARRLAARALPKTIPLPEGPEAEASREEAFRRARELVARAGLRTDLYVWLDVTVDVPYAEPSGASAEGVWVTLRHQPLRRLGEVSFVLGAMRNKPMPSARLVIPGELRDEIERVVEEVLA